MKEIKEEIKEENDEDEDLLLEGLTEEEKL